MALTNAERKKRYLEKLKATGQYENFKKKKANDETLRQRRIKNGLEQLPKAIREKTKRLNREYNRKKAAAYRRRKRENMGLLENEATRSRPNETVNTSDELGPYNTTSAVAKAVAKLKRALPSVSAKNRVVVRKYVRSLDVKDQEFIGVVVNSPSNRKRKIGIKSDTIEAIKAFYERDDISRISPKIRDCRKFKNPVTGVKEEKQIRYLMYKLSDVHKLFVQRILEGNDEQKQSVGLSKFSSLRPSHVKLQSSTPLEQALCQYHTNFIMCCKAIHQKLPNFPDYGAELEHILLCENPQRECWFRECSKCVNVKVKLSEIMKRSRINGKTLVKWCQWKKNKENNRFEKCEESGTLSTLISHFLDILPEFLKHSYIKRAQETQFQKDSEEVSKSNGKLASLQVDFAEGFNCEHQDEVQSAHWNQATV